MNCYKLTYRLRGMRAACFVKANNMNQAKTLAPKGAYDVEVVCMGKVV